jgi:hypothetical protein
MNRHQRRAANNYLQKESAKQPDRLALVPPAEWPRPEPGLMMLLRSSKFLVQVYSEKSNIIRLSVCRTVIDNQGKWQDNITWEELQEIKNQSGFGQLEAVEIYPPEKDVVNVANMRHLWVLPVSLGFAWRAKNADQ